MGMQYRVTVDKRLELDVASPFKIKLEREPDNFNDKNAIKVVIDDKTLKNNGMHVGYVGKLVAEVWAPAMDSGKLKILESWMVGVPESGDGEMFVKINTPPKARKTLQKKS